MNEFQPSQEDIEKRIELIKQNCVMCKIVKGEIEAKKVYEDDVCLAVLDINPATKGHLILFPKEHYMMMPLVPDDVLGHIGVISKYLSDLLKETFGAENVDVQIANGAAAGQQSQHFLMHVIPRYSDDTLDFSLKGESQYREEELLEFVEKVKEKLKQQG